MELDEAAALIIGVLCVLLIMLMLGPALVNLAGESSWTIMGGALCGAAASALYLYVKDPEEKGGLKVLKEYVNDATGSIPKEHLAAALQS